MGRPLYVGKASIHTDKDGTIVLKKDPAGLWGPENIEATIAKMYALAKERKTTVSSYGIFFPQPKEGPPLPKSHPRTPIMQANRFGNPFITMAYDEPAKAKTVKPSTKLA
jgi:hypothetical protein